MDPIEQALERLLVLKCQMGDRPALEQLFQRHNSQLGYYLRRLLGRDEAAADVQQEVWLTVIRQVARLRAPEAFVTWLYRIARSKAINRLAEHERPRSLDLEPVAGELADDSTLELSPADAAAVHQALQKLRPEHREALTLRFMEDLTYEQIAEVVGCNVGTVRSRLHYAKLALRRELENQHD